MVEYEEASLERIQQIPEMMVRKGGKRRKKEMLGGGYGGDICATGGNVTCQFGFIVFVEAP